MTETDAFGARPTAHALPGAHAITRKHTHCVCMACRPPHRNKNQTGVNAPHMRCMRRVRNERDMGVDHEYYGGRKLSTRKPDQQKNACRKLCLEIREGV